MNFEQQDWIDSYLFGELEGQELQRFEAKMREDAHFREEVHLQKEIALGISSYFAVKPQAIKLHSKSKLVWIKRGLGVAATIALIITAGIAFQNVGGNLKSTPMAAEKTEKSTNRRDCENETFFTSSTILAMASFNSNCRVPAFSAPKKEQDADDKHFYNYPSIFAISA